MTKVYYNEATKLEKKVKLGSYLDSLNMALDDISKVDVSDNWKSVYNSDVANNLSDLIAMIPKIKSSLKSFEDFLGVADNTYNDVSDEIEGALKRYNGEK